MSDRQYVVTPADVFTILTEAAQEGLVSMDARFERLGLDMNAFKDDNPEAQQLTANVNLLATFMAETTPSDLFYMGLGTGIEIGLKLTGGKEGSD
jgi:hypothetical protein